MKRLTQNYETAFNLVAGGIQLSNFDLIKDFAEIVDFIESPFV